MGDVCDNCPHVQNRDQKDMNADGIGDACDTDTDGDGRMTQLDKPMKSEGLK